MTRLTDKAKNLFSKRKSGNDIRSDEVPTTTGARATYHEGKPSIPLESIRTTLIDETLEQVRRDPDANLLLEKSGLPINNDEIPVDSDTNSARLRDKKLSDEEHRLLSVFVLLNNGDTKFNGGYWASAEISYKEAQKAAAGTKDKSLQAICLAGVAAAGGMQGKYELSLKQFEDALRRKPDLAETWYNKGITLLILGRYGEALPCFDEVLQFKPDLAEAWYNKGVVLGHLNRYQDALNCFDKALEYNIHDPGSWLGKGVSLLILARNDEALASFEESLRDRPEFADAWLGRGLSLMMLARLEEGLSSIEQALRYKPESAEAWVGKGQVLGDLGRHEEAGACFEKALGHKPDFAAAWHSKGVALEKLGWWKQALAAFERASALEKGKQ